MTDDEKTAVCQTVAINVNVYSQRFQPMTPMCSSGEFISVFNNIRNININIYSKIMKVNCICIAEIQEIQQQK